jgi:gluconolactonase
MSLKSLTLSAFAFTGLATAALNDIVSIDPSLTYNLGGSFTGNVSQNFIDTITSDPNTTALFEAARNATFISYSAEFLSIIGPKPTLNLVQQRNYSFASEVGVWVPNLNEVWFTGATINEETLISVLNLKTNEVATANTSIPIININGGYFFNGNIYFAADGNATVNPAIYEVDPATGDTKILIDSYFGLPFNGPNDIVWVKSGREPYIFFTDDPLSSLYDGGPVPVLVDAVWRFSPSSHSLIPVISRADVLVPNGIAVNAEQTKLYVTDTTPIYPGVDSAANDTGSNGIFVYDINPDGWPVNKRLFALSRRGFPDGIKVDDAGRVWTGEGEGLVVRDENGVVLGLFNTETLQPDRGVSSPLENFAIAGQTLVIEANQNLWTLELAADIMGTAKFYL